MKIPKCATPDCRNLPGGVLAPFCNDCIARFRDGQLRSQPPEGSSDEEAIEAAGVVSTEGPVAVTMDETLGPGT